MGRRTFVYVNGVGYERGVEEIPGNPLECKSQLGAGVLWGDRGYDGLRATDGTPIDSRSKHREYMRANGLTTADDFWGEWKQSTKERVERLTTGGDHRGRREDIGRAYQQVAERTRRK